MALPAVAVLAFLAMSGHPACAAEAVIVASTAPGFVPGQVVADGAPLTVPDGASAFLLLSSGRTVRIKGPYDGPLDRMAQAVPRVSAGGSFLDSGRLAQDELGAARAIGFASLQPPAGLLETIDIGMPGPRCIKAGTRPTLKRPDGAEAVSGLRLSRGEGGPAVTVPALTMTWPGEARTAPWPAAWPVEDGSELVVSGPDGAERLRLRLRLLTVSSGPALAVGLAAAGCHAQAAAVLAPLRDTVVPLDIFLSTDRGLTPTYRRGEPVRLTLRANRDAHVYCFLRNAGGQLVSIFPSAVSGGSLVESREALTLPGGRVPAVVGTEHAGDMEVRCFAAARDIGADLPPAGAAAAPLDDDALKAFDRALNQRGDREVVMAQVILRVE
jgi:hypothetical protein